MQSQPIFACLPLKQTNFYYYYVVSYFQIATYHPSAKPSKRHLLNTHGRLYYGNIPVQYTAIDFAVPLVRNVALSHKSSKHKNRNFINKINI